jgi:DNA-binding transcriptional MerR regulator
MKEALTIGAVAKGAGVRVDTVRYYERRGVLPTAKRKTSGYRLFEPQAITRIVFVKELQALGFSLDEIIDVLRLADVNATTCASALRHAKTTLERIDAKIAALTATRGRLASYVGACGAGACSVDAATPRIRLPLAALRGIASPTS